MKTAVWTLAVAGLAVLGVRSFNRFRRTHLNFQFPTERSSSGLFV
jgi:hypothetical protein